MNEVNLYGGKCPHCKKKKLDFRTDSVEKHYILFASCEKCKKVFMLDLSEEPFDLDNVKIDDKEVLEFEDE